MITYLPEIYPDELVYSWFCRYYVHSGYFTHKAALQDILQSRHNNPSKEFLGYLNNEMLTVIRRMYPIDKIILEHTMFPQYARFIPLEQKKKALYCIGNDFCDVHHLFSVLPRSDADSYLKYCPLCVKEDREKYGETYWHRTHQIRGTKVCYKHNCMLECSTVTANSEHTYTFCPAEEYAVKQTPILTDNVEFIRFAEYLNNVFNAPIDFEKDIPISSVLYYAMLNTNYIKSGCKIRNTKRLSDDIKIFYENIGISDIASFSQVQRLLLGDRFNFSVVCQIAFYLGIDVNDLTYPSLTTEQIERERNTHFMKNREDIDWATYDQETAPILERVAKGVYDGKTNEKGRPERVSERLIYREMDLPQHRLEILPKCRAVFEKYSETYEENWARRIVWAYDKLKEDGKPFYWSNIRSMTGVKKKNIDKVIPIINRYTDNKNAYEIIELVGEG